MSTYSQTFNESFPEPIKPVIEVPKPGQKIPVGDGSPVTMNVGDSVTAVSNTTITIRCPVRGVPTPDVTWEKDGKQVTPGGRFSISSDYTLMIKEAAVDDSAEYTCSVKSVAGTDSESSTVEIISKLITWQTMTHSLYEMCLKRIMVVVFINFGLEICCVDNYHESK